MKKKSESLIGSETRTYKQLFEHYRVEKAIADKLKTATREERSIIYKTMYEELFEKVPDHPQLTRQQDMQSKETDYAGLVEKVIGENSVVVEFGPGDCRFAVKLANQVKYVYAVDISDQRSEFVKTHQPANFDIVIYDGQKLDIAKESVDWILSDQMIEHLHPEDVESHFRLAKQMLKQGGTYLFATPHLFDGPHDISRYFSDVAEGFHLKEWTYCELAKFLKDVGFSSCRGYWIRKKICIKLPLLYYKIVEPVISCLPRKKRKRATRYFIRSIIIKAVK